jgi:hypothetical protein
MDSKTRKAIRTFQKSKNKTGIAIEIAETTYTNMHNPSAPPVIIIIINIKYFK